MTECEFCGLDKDIYPNPEWDFDKALEAVETKNPPLPNPELPRCCLHCAILIGLR